MSRVPILDHGYLEYVEHWGSDERIVEAARMSTGKGFLGWGPKCPLCGNNGAFGETMPPFCFKCGNTVELVSGDEKLLRYLWENKHLTPFEMPGLTVEVQAPIMVFREWHRHRVPFGYNEMSARYTPLPDVNYVPSVERLMMGSDGKNRQAGTVAGAAVLTVEQAEAFRLRLQTQYMLDQETYEWALAAGVPKELARVHLPVGRYSRMRATGNLRGWLAFLALRMAPSAQWEIRQYACAVGALIAQHFPRTWALFSEVRNG
jgi:thymidylate synthase (FAD)